MTGPPLELLTVGRISVDLYATEALPLAEATTFRKSIGGSPTNVAVAAARLGRRSAVVTAVGDDPLGRYAVSALARFGVDTRFVGTHPTYPTPIVVAAAAIPDDPEFVFYRQPAAPDSAISLDDVDLDVVRTVPIFWVTGCALAVEPSRATTLAMLAARERRVHTVLDLDYRPSFWASEAEASAVIGDAVRQATAVVGNREECRVALGTNDPAEAAAAILERGAQLAVVKKGGEGVLVVTARGSSTVPPCDVEVVCGLGAGDAFGGALSHGLLAGLGPEDTVRFANAAGAIVASRLLCADAMPALAEVEELSGMHTSGVHA